MVLTLTFFMHQRMKLIFFLIHKKKILLLFLIYYIKTIKMLENINLVFFLTIYIFKKILKLRRERISNYQSPKQLRKLNSL